MRLRMQFGVVAALMTGLVAAGVEAARGQESRRPNVILIMSDDQGYGDLGSHGNPVIRTPNLDRFAKQGVEIRTFYVCPVCAPTRASLMTGRYNYRTRVTDTYIGRALMDPDEVTLAEMLGSAGYRTGIFGKWHLGDNAPLRPNDQGFQESLVLRGGGLGQPSDSPRQAGSRYTDPVLLHNGRELKTKGYCSDLFTQAAIRFIQADRDRPFFVYLPFNAPHTPLEVPEYYRAMYAGKDLSTSAFPEVGRPIEGKIDPEATARVYGMETNIDDNVGRLLARLGELGLAENTIVIFLTDNGPQQPRYNAGLRGRKGTVYEGGIRVPFFVRWPGHFEAGRQLDVAAAHIDIAPTLLEACGVAKPEGVTFDGRSLLPLLEGKASSLPERTLFFQWHRGYVPELFRCFAARDARWKLLQPQGTGEGPGPKDPRFELYDLKADPYEQHDLAKEKPEVVERLKAAYETWFRDVCATRGFDAPRILLGSERENPTLLTRQDWRGEQASWGPKGLGHWDVEVARTGDYRVTLLFDPPGREATVRLAVGGVAKEAKVGADESRHSFEGVKPKLGPSRLEASITRGAGGERAGVQYVEIERH